MSEEILSLDACRLAPAMRAGRATSKEYAGVLLNRYETDCKYDSLFTPTFHADEVKKTFGVEDKNTAPTPLSPAKKVASAAPRGALAGVPFIVSANIDALPYTTSAGATSLERALPETDASVISALKGAGATVLAQANMGELGTGVTGTNTAYGTVKNPYTGFGVTGGSASGAAAAVAARLAPFAVAIDSVGDVRVPAALCGVVGYRPTHGRYNREGLLSLSHTLDTVSFVARSVHDCQLLDAVVCAAQKPHESAVAASSSSHPSAGAGSGAASTEEEKKEDASSASADPSYDAAVVKIQSASRGFVARRRVQKVAKGEISAAEALKSSKEMEDERQAAAARIQALARGKADRGFVARQATQKEAGATRLEALQQADDAAAKAEKGDVKGARAAAAAVLETAGAIAVGAEVFDAAASGAGVDVETALDTGKAAFVKDLAGVRIGVPRKRYYEGLDAALSATVEQALGRLTKSGAILVEIDFPESEKDGVKHPMDLATEVIAPIQAYEAPRELSSYLFTHVAGPEPVKPKAVGEDGEEEPPAEEEDEEGAKKAAAPVVPAPLDSIVNVTYILQNFKGSAADKDALVSQLSRATATTATIYRAALVHSRPALKRSFTSIMKSNKLSAIVYPATPLPAAPARGADGSQVEHNGQCVDASTLYTRNTRPASAAGLPALCIPCGMTKPRPGAPKGSPGAERLPVSLEFIAAANDDERLLALGRAFQRLQSLLPDPIVIRRWNAGVTYPHMG